MSMSQFRPNKAEVPSCALSNEWECCNPEYLTFTYASGQFHLYRWTVPHWLVAHISSFFLQARRICPLMLQLRHVAFLNLHLDCTWPAFPHEKQVYEFDWGGEGEFGRTPWRKEGGTREFPPEDGKTAEFLETESTDEDDERVEFLEAEFTDWIRGSCCWTYTLSFASISTTIATSKACLKVRPSLRSFLRVAGFRMPHTNWSRR